METQTSFISDLYKKKSDYNNPDQATTLEQSLMKILIRKLIITILAIVFNSQYLQANAINDDSTFVGNSNDYVEDTLRIPSKDEIVASGIPNCAIPAQAYFECLKSDNANLWSELSVKESTLYSEWQDFDAYCFFVNPTMKRTDEYPLVDVWAHNANKRKSKLMYHQVDDSIDTRNVVGIDWMYGGKDHSEPILILSTIGTTQTCHYDYYTVIIDVLKDRIITLKGQKFVSILHIYDEILPAYAIGWNESYILTTTSDWKFGKKGDLLFSYLNIYDSNGSLIRKIALPIKNVPGPNEVDRK